MRLVSFGCWEEYKGGPLYLLRRLTPDEVDMMLHLAKTPRSALVVDVTLWAKDLERLYQIENNMAPPATGFHDADGVFAPGRPSMEGLRDASPIDASAARVSGRKKRAKRDTTPRTE